MSKLRVWDLSPSAVVDLLLTISVKSVSVASWSVNSFISPPSTTLVAIGVQEPFESYGVNLLVKVVESPSQIIG